MRAQSGQASCLDKAQVGNPETKVYIRSVVLPRSSRLLDVTLDNKSEEADNTWLHHLRWKRRPEPCDSGFLFRLLS